MSAIQVRDLHFKYPGKQAFNLQVNKLDISAQSRVYIEGPSGCGKSTFLSLLTGLITPQKGEIRILGTPLSNLSQVQCDQFRATHFGIIFQLFNLIPYLTVIENIILPCTFSKVRHQNALASQSSLVSEALRLARALEISDELLDTPVTHLSIGQQQRVAIARAIIGKPELIIADEPTSALDQTRKAQFLDLLLKETQRYNATLILVSHDEAIKSQFDHVVSLDTPRALKQEIQNVTF